MALKKDIDEAFVATSTEWHDPVRGAVNNQTIYKDMRRIGMYANLFSLANNGSAKANGLVDELIQNLRVGD